MSNGIYDCSIAQWSVRANQFVERVVLCGHCVELLKIRENTALLFVVEVAFGEQTSMPCVLEERPRTTMGGKVTAVLQQRWNNSFFEGFTVHVSIKKNVSSIIEEYDVI